MRHRLPELLIAWGTFALGCLVAMRADRKWIGFLLMGVSLLAVILLIAIPDETRPSQSHNQTVTDHSEVYQPRTEVTVTSNSGAVGVMVNSPNSTQNVVNQGSAKRTISESQAFRMKEILVPYAGSRIVMVSSIGDDEGLRYARRLESAFNEAGWQASYAIASSPDILPSILIRVPKDNPDAIITNGTFFWKGRFAAVWYAVRVVETNCVTPSFSSPYCNITQYGNLRPDEMELRIGPRP